jgi:DNA primase
MTIVEYLRLRGVTVRGNMFACPSPDHADTHASASAKGEVWYCHGCGSRGNLVGLVAQLEGCSVREAMARLGKERRLYVPMPPPKPLYPSIYESALLYAAAVPVDWDRTGPVDLGLAFELADGCELPAWAQGWRGRVIVPLRDCFGTGRSFVARAKGRSAAKSLTPKGFSTKGLAFFTGIGYSSRCIIAEGEMDYLAARAMSDTVIGVRSGSWCDGWRRLLERHGLVAEVWTDNDAAGDRYAEEIMKGTSWTRHRVECGDLEDYVRRGQQ